MYPEISEVGRVENIKGTDPAQHKSSQRWIPTMTFLSLVTWSVLTELEIDAISAFRKSPPARWCHVQELLRVTPLFWPVIRVTLCICRLWHQVKRTDLHTQLRKGYKEPPQEAEPWDLLSFHLPICWTLVLIPINLIPDSIPASNTTGFSDSEFLPCLFYQGSYSPMVWGFFCSSYFCVHCYFEKILHSFPKETRPLSS